MDHLIRAGLKLYVVPQWETYYADTDFGPITDEMLKYCGWEPTPTWTENAAAYLRSRGF